MKNILGITSIAAVILASCGGKTSATMAEGYEGLNSKADSVSYYNGMVIAKSLAADNIDKLLVPNAFEKGMEDRKAEAELLLGGEAGNQMMQNNIMNFRMDSADFDFVPAGLTGFTSLANQKDSVSYFLGTNVYSFLEANKFTDHFSKASFYKGMEDELMKNSPALSEEDGEALARQIVDEARQEMMAAQKEQFAGKIAEGEAFLAEKTAQEDVVTLPSGLRYKILKEGNGPKPAATDIVSTHYHGTLIDGTVFDSSVDRGEPTEFPVNRVIPGWTEALQLMPVGSKWELYIPYNLAYGEQGAGASIEPYSTLIFEVELLEIKKEQE